MRDALGDPHPRRGSRLFPLSLREWAGVRVEIEAPPVSPHPNPLPEGEGGISNLPETRNGVRLNCHRPGRDDPARLRLFDPSCYLFSYDRPC